MPTKFPFPDLKIGEYFTVPIDEASAIRNLAYYHGEKLQRRFATHDYGDLMMVVRIPTRREIYLAHSNR